MEKTKDEILSDLYSIRAVMSVVSQNEDTTQKNYKLLNDLDFEIKKVNQVHDEIREEFNKEYYRYSIDAEIDANKSILKKKKDDVAELMNSNRSIKTNSFNRAKELSRYAIILPLLPIFLLAALLVLITYKCSPIKARNNKEIKKLNNDIEELQIKIVELENLKGNIGAFRPEKLDTIKAIQKRNEDKVNQQEFKLTSIINQKKNVSEEVKNKLLQSKLLIESTADTFDLIDSRDWENLDLLIYYFETGRADTIKEALQLVDRQKQADTIAEAIVSATYEISRTITQSMNHLAKIMVAGFVSLSNQIAVQSSMLLNSLANLSNQIVSTNTNIDNLISATQNQITSQAMTNALLAKISVSSDILVNDMNQQLSKLY